MAEEVQYEPKPLPEGPNAPFGYGVKSSTDWKMQGACNGSGSVASGRNNGEDNATGQNDGKEPTVDLELCSGRVARVKGYLVPT